MVNLIQLIDIKRAVSEIKQACEESQKEGRQPFFFLVGAGISCPPIPLASEIIEECKARATKYGRTSEPSGKPMDIYSQWFQQAYPHSSQRQRYLRKLIEGKPISEANFRLAHLLLEKSITNIVVTTNFDDFLGRALTLFGMPHIICDHPSTAERIDLEQNDIQIIHVHGTYWFYDACNLDGEIEERSKASIQTSMTMASLLDRILSQRSPLVIGYDGWENDVVMTALKRRLQSPIPFNLYWFCYRKSDIEKLPEWLKSHRQVFFVVPPEKMQDIKATKYAGFVESAIMQKKESLSSKPEMFSKKEMEMPTLPATKVFGTFIEMFGIKNPELTSDPLGFFSKHLSNSLLFDSARQESDIYSIKSVIERVKWAKQKESTTTQKIELKMEKVRDDLRGSRYREAIRQCAEIDKTDLYTTQLRELIEIIWSATSRLSDNSQEELEGYDMVRDIGDMLLNQNIDDYLIRERVGEALFKKGYSLGELNRNEEAIAVYDDVIARFGSATEPALRKWVAMALFNKGYSLGALKRSEEDIAVYDDVIIRFGSATEPVLSEAVAKALVNKGYRLGALNRNEEGIPVYDDVVARFGSATEPALREQVAMALVNKGVTLGELNRNEEAIAVYDDVIARFGSATEPVLSEAVAKALVNKGVRLGELNRNEEEIAVYDDVIVRFGSATEPALRKWVAMALFNKGVTLGALNRNEEAIAVYDDVIAWFGSATEPALREQVAMALFNEGYSLGARNRNEEAIAVYDDVIARFGSATEPALRKWVAKAKRKKGIALKKVKKKR